MKLTINHKEIHRIFFPGITKTNRSYEMFNKYRDRYIDSIKITGGFTVRSLPLDWFLEEVQKDLLYSDREIELIRIQLEDEWLCFF